MKRYIRIHPADNVGLAIADYLHAGEELAVEGCPVKLNEAIPRGHKFALRDIAEGEPVIKYGHRIGNAFRDIRQGEWVHTHNLHTALGDNEEYVYTPWQGVASDAEGTSADAVPMINGYPRSGGEMGIRNELWIIPTVGCVNGSAQAIATRLRNEIPVSVAPYVDDITAFPHNYGCSQLGDDHANTRRALAALALHPNAGGVIVLGLGCENNRIDRLREEIELLAKDRDETPDWGRIRFLTSQEVEDEVEEGVRIGHELLEIMGSDRREAFPFSRLRLGLKCGGSDGLSGITANPLVGRLTDRIVAWGATAVLTEVPEMFGAETILMDRALDRTVFDKTVDLINGFKDYFRSQGQPVYENPSPGNKDGGITTLEEKSLGCIQKGGTALVTDVVMYGHPSVCKGLNLLNAPGNDLVASTALALSGCHMVLFTTGRGTPFGTCVPTVKISTNTALARRKPGWIDFNAGVLVENGDGEHGWSEALQSLLDEVVAVADGKRVKQETNGYKEIAIFKTGVTL